MESYFKNKGIVQLVLKWKFHILIIVAVSILASVIFSMPAFIKPQFKSFAVVYPVNVITYSQESNSENMMQILESQDIRDMMFEKFNLGSHYKIGKDDIHYYTKLNKEFEEKITIEKTEFESVNIIVYDTDPKQACDMVSAMIHFYDTKVSQMHKSKFREVMVIKEHEMNKKKIEVDSLERKMEEFRIKFGILDYGIQTEEATKGYMKMLASGKNPENSKEVSSLLQNLKEKGGEFNDINQRLWVAKDNFNTFKNQYETALEEVEKEITYSHVVSAPFAADKKSKPVRWMIIIMAAIGSLAFSIILIALAESIKKPS